MAVKKSAMPLKLGDLVKIRHSRGLRGKIVELWGALGPGGTQVYRVRVRGMSRPTYIDVREDQLEVVPEKARPLPER